MAIVDSPHSRLYGWRYSMSYGGSYGGKMPRRRYQLKSHRVQGIAGHRARAFALEAATCGRIAVEWVIELL